MVKYHTVFKPYKKVLHLKSKSNFTLKNVFRCTVKYKYASFQNF